MYSFATPNSSKLMTLSLGLTHTHTILMVNAAYDVHVCNFSKALHKHLVRTRNKTLRIS